MCSWTFRPGKYGDVRGVLEINNSARCPVFTLTLTRTDTGASEDHRWSICDMNPCNYPRLAHTFFGAVNAEWSFPGMICP